MSVWRGRRGAGGSEDGFEPVAGGGPGAGGGALSVLLWLPAVADARARRPRG